MNKKKLVVFSAIQPSGNLTIGNYIGVLKHWKKFQEFYKCIFCIADLHSLTSLNKENILNKKKSILDTLALYLACGVDPKKSIIFVQSSVSEHSELNWILNCNTNFKELMRMTQFKNSFKNINNNLNAGLFNYPTLMAADILLYNTDKVHIGEDQKQHLELTRKIAIRFNNYNKNIFKIPDFLMIKTGSKIMSLLNPKKKMSKSDKNHKNVIFLLDNSEEIFKKIKSSVTDSNNPPNIFFDPKKKPGISNLLVIFSTLSGISLCDVKNYFLGKSYSQFKNIVFKVINNCIKKIQKKFFFYRKKEELLIKIACKGAKKASFIAKKKLSDVYNSLGLLKKF